MLFSLSQSFRFRSRVIQIRIARGMPFQTAAPHRTFAFFSPPDLFRSTPSTRPAPCRKGGGPL